MKKFIISLFLFLAASPVFAATDFYNDPNLKGYYRFENNANDEKDYADGTTQNVSYAAGKFGNESIYGGSSSMINLGNKYGFKSPDVFSISFWIKTSTNGKTLINRYSSTDGYKGYELGIGVGGAGTGELAFYNGSTWTHSSTSVLTGTWQYAVIINDGTYTKYYINGTSSGQSTQASPNISSNAVNAYIGSTEGNAAWFNGQLDDLAFFTDALTTAEITELYNNGTGLEIYATRATTTQGWATSTTPATDSENLHYLVGLGTMAIILLLTDFARRNFAGLTR